MTENQERDPNPYHVPGMRSRIGPLCPYTHPAHEQFYVPVDHTEKAFEVFKKALGDNPAALRTEGRLAVALGWDGCGKTSLLNRCAHWVKGRLAQGCHIVPLVDAARDPDAREEREMRVGPLLIHELVARDLVEPKQREDLDKALEKGDLDFGYLYVSKYVLQPKSVVLVVLLPRTEIPREVENYARRAYPHLAFLAESRKVEAVSSWWPRIESAHEPSSPIRLDVGTLAQGDGWAFVRARKGDRTDAPDYPFVSEETIRRVTVARELSIGELHKLLYGTYQEFLERIKESGKIGSPMGEVTLLDLMEFHFRRPGRL